METRKMKLALSAGALALSLALAGCGGGGSPQSPTQAELDAQEAMKRAEMQMTAIMEAIKAAEMAVAAIDTANPTEAQVNDAASAVEAADMAVEAAVDVDDTSSYAATVMTLDNFVKVAQTAVTTGVSLAEAEKAKAAEEAARAAEEAARKAAEQVNTLFSQANDAESDAEDALEMATEALAMAKKMAGMLDVISVAGNSMTAMDNAQAILDAETDVGTALANAQKALADAMAAQTAANALPADTPELASLKTEIGEAIAEANDTIEAIEAIQADKGPTTLAAYVDDVKAGGKGTPTKTGEGIATMIGEAFTDIPARVSHTTAGTGAVAKAVATITGANPVDGKTARVLMHDAPATAMTWEQIVGASNVEKKPYGTNSADVSVTSVAGMDLSNFQDSTSGVVVEELPSLASGSAAIRHMGITGMLYCVGAASACTVKNGKLDGKLYFGPATPADINQRYTRAPDSETYEGYDLYATYGYWLSQAAADGDVTVNTFAGQSDDRIAVTAGVVGEATTLADSATYKGKAVGMSVHKTFNSDSVQTGISSGAFTATVSLAARFGGTSPSVSGTVSGFESEDNPGAVDSTWKVSLGGPEDGDGADLTGGNFDDGVTRDATEGRTAKGGPGSWSAQAYGEDGKRPTGIFGGFNAHFSDGHVAGAYATRK